MRGRGLYVLLTIVLTACDDGGCGVEPQFDDGTWTAAGITLEVEGRTVVARYKRCGEDVVETWSLSAQSSERRGDLGFPDADAGERAAEGAAARRCLASADGGLPDPSGAL
jgi:hypothetical protein